MKNVFVMTKNVKGFVSAMKEAEKAAGEPALLLFHGQAGRGKTSAAQYFSAQENWTYVRVMKGWTELWMLQDLCFEMSVDPIPSRKKQCFEAIKGRLVNSPRAVVMDEADKLSDALLEWIRDLADVTFCPFALVGEKLLLHKMQKERRIWSRTIRAMEFGPITAEDVLFFAKQAAEISLTAAQADQFRLAADGDFRLVKRDMRRLEELCQVNQVQRPSDDMVAGAIRQGLKGA